MAFPFLQLPPEIRNTIYTYALEVTATNRSHTALLRTSRRINQEARRVFGDVNQLVRFTTDLLDIHTSQALPNVEFTSLGSWKSCQGRGVELLQRIRTNSQSVREFPDNVMHVGVRLHGKHTCRRDNGSSYQHEWLLEPSPESYNITPLLHASKEWRAV